MKRTASASVILLVLLIMAVTWPTTNATPTCQRESRACTSCYWLCRNESDALMDSCVKLGNDWSFCKDKMMENMRKCGEQRCPDCSWIQTY